MNNWLNEDKDQIEYYVSSKDEILVGRKEQLQLMTEVFESYFPARSGLKFLDVGCGDGALTKLMCGKYPDNTFHLLDGSRTMLEKAKAEIKTDKASFFQDTFENFFHAAADEGVYDFIYSSMAIHHVEHRGKSELFSSVRKLLKPGGLFFNVDVVLPVSAKTESIQFKMWVDRINEFLAGKGRQNETGKHDGLPASYKGKSENKPSTLTSQLEMLEEIGFGDVECYYKNGIFVSIGCVKS